MHPWHQKYKICEIAEMSRELEFERSWYGGREGAEKH